MTAARSATTTSMRIATVIVCILTIAGVVACEVSIWRECRQDHSWIYCMRLMDKDK